MKKAILFLCMAALTCFFALTSCHKEEEHEPRPDDSVVPDTPTEPNYFTYGADSIDISAVVIGKEEEDYVYYFMLSNGNMFLVGSQSDIIDKGTRSFVPPISYYTSPDGVLGMYMTDEEATYMASGSFSIKSVSEGYELIMECVSDNAANIKAHYRGKVVDLTTSSGSGSFTINSITIPLNMAFEQVYEGMHEIALTDTAMTNGVTFYTLFPLADGGTYAISADEEAQVAGQAAALYVEITGDNGEYISGDAIDGTLHCTHSGDIYTLTFQGSFPEGHFSGNYTGSIYSIALQYATKKMRISVKSEL